MAQVFKDVSVKKLFKDLLRAAQYVGRRQGNEVMLQKHIRDQFRRNMSEREPETIQKHKEAALRALSNLYFQEAERLAKGKGKKPK